MKPLRLLKFIVPAAMLAFGTHASAAFITGSIAFEGALDTAPTSGNLSSATGLTFSDVTVTGGTQFGNYSSVPDGAPVTFNSVTFSPVTLGQLWSFNVGPTVYSFNMTSMTVIGPISFGDPASTILVLAGSGTASITGFDPTPGSWTVTANQSGASLSFSSSAAASPVPDGGATLALLGVSILGLGGARRFLPARKK